MVGTSGSAAISEAPSPTRDSRHGSRILVISIRDAGDVGQPLTGYSALLADSGCGVEQRVIREGSSPRQVLRALWLTRDVRSFDAVIASDYTGAFAVAIMALLLRSRALLIAVGFNLSRRPFRSGQAAIDRIVDRVFARLDRIVVHSTPEADQFVALHTLDRRRFSVVPWGFDLPPVADDVAALVPRTPYVAMIGRNNRDFEAAALGLQGTGIGGVFVGCGDLQAAGDTELRTFPTLPFDQCLGIMRNAIASLIILNDGNRGAGHITAVAGMLLERPHIFSDAPVIGDYLQDRVHGIAVPFGKPEALRHAIRQLADDPALRERYGRQGRETALIQMSNAAFSRKIAHIVLGELGRRRVGP